MSHTPRTPESIAVCLPPVFSAEPAGLEAEELDEIMDELFGDLFEAPRLLDAEPPAAAA